MVVRGRSNVRSQADSREKAKEFVERYDEVVAQPGGRAMLHRVSHYLASVDSGCLGRDLRAFADSGRMSKELRSEILAYQLCILDDSIQESPHAQVSRVASVARQSGPPWWSATIRMDQNVATKSSLDAVSANRFSQCFRAWKALGQCKWTRYANLVSQRVRTRPFLEMVYRTGSHCRADWSFLADLSESSTPTRDSVSRTAIQEVKIDFLKRVCTPHAMLTWGKPSSVPAVSDMGSVALPGQAQHSQLEPCVLQVVSYDFTRKKVVQTESARRWRRMLLPATVQRYGHWNAMQYPCPDLDVFPDGPPVLVDLHNEIAHDQYMCLRRWTVPGPSDVAGCWSLTDPEVIGERQWSSVAVTSLAS